MTDPAIAEIGDNQPPPQDTAAEMKGRTARLIDKTKAWLTTDIEGDDSAGLVGDDINELSAHIKEVDAERSAQKRPHIDANKAIDAAFVPLADAARTLRDALKKKLGVYMDAKRERERKEAEAAAAEARRLEEVAAEAEQKADQSFDLEEMLDAGGASKKAEEARSRANYLERAPTRVRGAHSSRSRGFRKTWHAEVTDLDKCFAHYRENPKVRELLTSLASADARGGRRRIPGCRVDEKESLT